MISQELIQQRITELSDICLDFDANVSENRKVVPEKYRDTVVMDLALIMSHVLINRTYYTIKDEKEMSKAQECGNSIHELLLKYTGVNTKTFYNKK